LLWAKVEDPVVVAGLMATICFVGVSSGLDPGGGFFEEPIQVEVSNNRKRQQ